MGRRPTHVTDLIEKWYRATDGNPGLVRLWLTDIGAVPFQMRSFTFGGNSPPPDTSDYFYLGSLGEG